MLRVTRESSGVSIEEASRDLNIKEVILENIEDGKIGSFKDVFLLKTYIYDYAKYLGLDGDKLIDSFNEYLFEYTSKIPIDDIEKAIVEQKKEENKEAKERIVSPYTNSVRKTGKWLIVLYIVVAIIALLVVLWAVKLLTGNTSTTNMVSYIDR
jgi:cytoskeletal protein RodZ